MKRIPLRARDGSVRAYALVDTADFEWLNQWRWHLGPDGYAERSERWGGGGKYRTILMHRLILGLEYGDRRQGEHENRNRLDYRRENLRVATHANADNQQNHGLRGDNKSGYRGVHWDTRAGKWHAEAQVKGKPCHLGSFGTAEEADIAAKAFRAEHMPFSEGAGSARRGEASGVVGCG